MERSTEIMATISSGGAGRDMVVGRTLFEYADELGIRVPASCGGTGFCHECIVEVGSGDEALSPPSAEEEFLSWPYRLACRATIANLDCDVEFALMRRSPQILTEGRATDLDLDPAIVRRGDEVFCGDDAIGDYRGHIYGLAVDVGTTTIVAQLVDLESGRPLVLSSFENPQRFGGSDVMHRISYDGGPFRGELHKTVINALNREIGEMCGEVGVSRREVYEISVAGNATMRDMFFGLDVQPIGRKPFRSTVEQEYRDGKRETTSLTESAARLKIRINPKGRVYGAPLIACHVGADTAAALVTLDVESWTGTRMFMDVGTNTEIVIGHEGRLLAASCAAGPAYEGWLVRYGMPGYDGAIESVRLENGSFACKTIGGVAPRGICGSGMIDLLAELRRSGQMAPQGQFADGGDRVTIAPDQNITFSRQDASHLAQSKSAQCAGQLLVMQQLGIGPRDIEKLYLAGGFANYVHVANAIEIGFLPPLPVERIEKIGNAAAQGARELLLSRGKRADLERLVAKIDHLELETSPNYFDAFVEGLSFDPMPEEGLSAT